jgi:hypothetical protein
MSEEDAPLARIVAIGIESIGAGVGALFGTNVDPGTAAVAAMAGTGIAAVGADLARRLLSPRQEVRVGEVFVQAGAALKAKEVMGEHIRGDGFFADGERSAGHEFAEGVMLAAMDSFEEKKIPYLANLLANVAVSPNIDAHTANFMLLSAGKISWLQFCLLGIIARAEEYPLPDTPFLQAQDWDRHTARTTLQRMADMTGPDQLLHFKTVKREGGIGLQLWDLNMNGIEIGSFGGLIINAMDLHTIPRDDLGPIYDLLFNDAPSNAA